MAVSKRLRYEILRRDNHACRYCGATAPEAKLVVDHVTPTALGGTDTPDNLVTACDPCNSGKSSVPADAQVVADVAGDALRWAAAIKQAAAELEAQAKPREDYRATFKTAWDEWTYPSGSQRKTFDLDPEWRSSLERFRQAGLPAAVWPEIVDKAMANKTVKADNIFRYCCGIAWRMVTELQKRARSIVGSADATETAIEEEDVFSAAALQAWVNEWVGTVSNEDGRAFEASLKRAGENESPEYPHRLIKAAQYSAWFGLTDVEAGIAAMDRDKAASEWLNSWHSASGDYPETASMEHVDRQIRALLDGGVNRSRVVRAASYAGAHRSARLYFGLGEKELELSGASAGLARICEIWAVSFQATADRWPNEDEREALLAAVRRLAGDNELFIADLYAAAAAAGCYQDPDLSTCLARKGSAFEVAAVPLQRGAV